MSAGAATARRSLCHNAQMGDEPPPRPGHPGAAGNCRDVTAEKGDGYEGNEARMSDAA
jgi:hypothetical protein